MTARDRLPAGIYLSPRHDGMVVMVDAGGFPRPVSEDYDTLISHNGQPDHLAKLWGPLTPAKVVPADAIVIDRDDLPEVVPHPRVPKTFTVGSGERTTHSAHDAKYARERGIGYLAIAEHLENHPPIDEAQVDALAKVLAVTDEQGEHAANLYIGQARRLVAAGVRAPQAGDDQ